MLMTPLPAAHGAGPWTSQGIYSQPCPSQSYQGDSTPYHARPATITTSKRAHCKGLPACLSSNPGWLL